MGTAPARPRLCGHCVTTPAPPLPESISVTSIYSLTDPGIQPARDTSPIQGAVNLAVQDVCPNQPAGHATILLNNTAFELVLDALTHDGPADPARLPSGTCRRHVAPDTDLAQWVHGLPAIFEGLAAFGEPRYLSEPPLPDYARADGARGEDGKDIAAGSAHRLEESGSTVAGGVIGSATSSR